MFYVADFETIVDVNDCRVWAWAISNDKNKIEFGNSIETFIDYIKKLNKSTIYFHNLKFDGEFILSYILKQGFKYDKDLNKNTFNTLISDMNQFYCINLNIEGTEIKLLDSLKILPFKVEEISKAFNLPMKKLNIDYKEKREIGHVLTEEEIEYIKNDVLIVVEAIKILHNQSLKKMTTASNALSDYKKIMGRKFDYYFPIPENDKYIRKSYKGGFTYVNPEFKEKILKDGIVLDVNSLYPSVMYEKFLPYGEPVYYTGKYEKDGIYNLYVCHILVDFELKEGYIPTIQIKNNLSFISNEYLTSSNGEIVDLYLTNIDLELMMEHYEILYIKYIDGFKYKSSDKIFKQYIDKWISIKNNATIEENKPMRTLAKLMLNSLYGKFAVNPEVYSKIPYIEDEIVKYRLTEPEQRKPLYIAIGSFITAYSREKTIRSAQCLKERFIYADTDSLHLLGSEKPNELEIDDVKLGAWKLESRFTKAKFLRQKCYLEEINDEINIKCAGMPPACYPYVNFENFKYGTCFPGKLRQAHVKGGIVLVDTDFTIKS